MEQRIKISVVVPVYNLQEKLARCVASIASQTYQNLEIILVDDGSKDDSRSVIEHFARQDKRIIPIYKENGGVTSARLEGARRASGEYIGFVDGDDEIEPEMYEFLLNNAIEYQAEISHCGHKMIYENGTVKYFYDTDRLVIQDRMTGIRDLLEGTMIEPGLWNKLFHRSLFGRLLNERVMDLSIKVNEDLLMNYYLFSVANKAVFEDKCMYRYFASANCKLNKYRIFDPIRVKQIILRDCDLELQTDAEKALLNTCVYVYCGLVLKKNIFKNEKSEVRTLVQKYYRCANNLPKRTRVLAAMIAKTPRVFAVFYSLYSKYVQKKKYE